MGSRPLPGRWADQQHVQFPGERDEFLLGTPPFLARLAVSGTRQEGCPDPPGGGRTKQVGNRLGGSAYEHEVHLAIGELVQRGEAVDAEHARAVAVGREDLARVATRQDVVQAHESELARVR